MLNHLADTPPVWAWLSVILLLGGEIAALRATRNLYRLIVVSTIAEIGYALLGFSVGGPSGEVGAFMHIVYQAVMRGLLVLTVWWMAQRAGSPLLADLTGAERRQPVAATLFGFAAFSVMGLSPFKGSYSKFMVLYAAVERGWWLLAAVGILASIIAAVYYIQIIQRVCLAEPEREAALAPAPRGWALPLIAVLSALTVLISLWPDPVVELATALAGGIDAASLPRFEAPWMTIALVPYAGGFVLFALGRVSPRLRDIAAVALAAAVVAMVWLEPGLDPASRLFALIFAGIGFLTALYSVGYMGHAEHRDSYWFFLFLMIGSLLGVATASEFGNFYVFWELMTWSSYLLVTHERTDRALRAGFVYFVMCAGGAYVTQFGILLIHAQVGTFDMALIGQRVDAIGPVAGAVAVLCILAGFLVKAGFFPAHSWLPLAHPAAPSSISGPLSGILTKAGVFGIVKVLFTVFGATALARFSAAQPALPTIASVVTALGCATLLYGEVMALRQGEIKRMLAYSTLAQIGEIGAVLGLGSALATTGALMHVTNHAVMKTLLFFAVGAFVLRTGRRQIESLAGLGRAMPFTAACYAIATLSIMGLPPFGGFVSKFLMIIGAAEAGRVDVAAILLFGSIIAVFYYIRVVRLLFFHPYQGETVAEAPLSMRLAMGLMAALVIAGGLAPSWQLGLVQPVSDLIAAKAGLASAVVPSVVMHWSAASVVPVLGALAVWLVGRSSKSAAGALAVLVCVATVIAVAIDAGRFDGLSLGFALIVAVLGTANMVYALGYMAHGHAQPRFYAMFLLLIAGLIGMAASRDLFNFFAFWELMSGWPLYFAIIHEETADARREGFKYFIFNTVGATLMFLGIAMLGGKSAGLDFASVAAALPGMPVAWMGSALALVFAGMVMKAAQLPVRIDYQMHPATAPTPVSGYISAVLLKSGPWGVLKLFVLAGGASLIGRLGLIGDMPALMNVIAVIGAVTILYAGAMAMIQNGIKRLLIYSTVCQLGYMVMAIAIATPLGVAGGLMHLANHALIKDLLFMAAGCVMVRSHAETLDQLGGLGRRMPVTFTVFLFAGLSLAGLPPLNGFASKWMIFQAAFQSGHPLLGAAAMVSSLFTLAAMLKFAHAAFMGVPSAAAAHAEEAPLTMLAPMIAMTAACVVLGVAPGLLLTPISGILAQLGMEPVAATWFGPLPGLEGWHPGILSILMLVLIPLPLAYLRRGRGTGVIAIHNHTCGVTTLAPAAAHVNASNLFETPDRIIRDTLRVRDRA